MTYRQACKMIKQHKGRVYTRVNTLRFQYHIEAKKGEMHDLFYNYGLTYGMDSCCNGLTLEVVSGDLILDTVSE